MKQRDSNVDSLEKMKELTPLRRSSGVLRAELVLKNIMNRMKVENNELTVALNIFQPVPVREERELSTDGIKLYYNPKIVLLRAKHQEDYLKLQLYHLVMHGLLGHYEYQAALSNPKRMSAIMDLEATQLLGALPNETFSTERITSELNQVIVMYPNSLVFDAYGADARKRTSLRSFTPKRKYLCTDDHSLWFNKKKPGKMETDKNSQDGNDEGLNKKSNEISVKWRDARTIVTHGTGKNGRIAAGLKAAVWNQGISRESGNRKVIQEKKKVYYEDFLENFIQHRELYREGDTIDKMLYQYGMELYGDIPIVEPMESSETRAVNTLAFAVDTSGSCYSDHVKQFLYVTTQMLERMCSDVLFERIILFQCDSKIHMRHDIRTVEELKKICEQATLYGGGGTDFRPVFESLDDEVEQGVKIDGLIYFTDAEGTYPKQKPSYPVTFVLPGVTEKQEIIRFEIPEWINQVELKEEN